MSIKKSLNEAADFFGLHHVEDVIISPKEIADDLGIPTIRQTFPSIREIRHSMKRRSHGGLFKHIKRNVEHVKKDVEHTLSGGHHSEHSSHEEYRQAGRYNGQKKR